MKKCDVIIPVYKSPEWVKICVYSLFKNTDENVLGTVYLINDCDDELTINCLDNLSKKYKKIKVLKNEKNLGFIKTTNRGMKESNGDYVLLLNTDCIVSKNAISKLINHIEKNKKIGLICPISSNAANLTFDMYEGFSFMQMNELFERKFKGINFDACTVVGNCLMITRECIEKTGYLDEAYGTGYGEETDYQFKAMSKGFEAKVAIDTYVFHKSEVSFGTSKEKQERLKKNRDLFFSRWGNDYNKLLAKYQKNDPIEYINKNITEEDKKIDFEFLMYLIGFTQNAGGVHMSVDMINYLNINGLNCNIFYSFSNGYDEILLFKPIEIKNIDKYKFKKIVSTIYSSTYYVKKIADEKNVPLIYFAQGYEPYFENGGDYGVAELSYKLADNILTISNYLKDRYYDMFDVEYYVIPNGINYDLLHKKNNNKEIKTITFVLRNNYLKGDFILYDLIKKLSKLNKKITINILNNNEYVELPLMKNDLITINEYKGLFTRKELANIFQNSDLYVDASLTEGFGLVSLEAMAAGNVVVASNSGGVNEYLKNGVNGIIINDVNNIYSYYNAIINLLDNPDEYIKLKKNVENTAKKFDYDLTIDKYSEYFNKNIKKKNISLDENELEIYDDVLDKRFKVSVSNKRKNFLYKVCKKTPRRFRVFVKRQVEKLYKFTNER